MPRLDRDDAETPSHSGEGRRFLTLEGLRGVAALAIVFTHLGGVGAVLFSHGYLAVDLFFLMSGAVIAHAYERRLRSGWSIAQFMGARLKRLAPIYLAGAVLGAACSLIAHGLGYGGDGPVLFNLTLALLFIPAVFSAGDLYPLNAPCWSLFAELCANLGYGAAAKTLSFPKLIGFTALAAAALILFILKSPVDANVGVSGVNGLGGMARVAFGFPMGVILYRLLGCGKLPVPSLPAPLILAIALATFMAPWRGAPYDLAVILIVYPLLVASALREPIRAQRGGSLFALAGAVSYPLYALHYPLAKLASLYMPADGARSLIAVLLCAAELVLIAYAAMRLFDEPVRARMRRWSVPALIGG